MGRFETAKLTQAYRERCEDCLAVIEAGDRTVIVVADGAGGSGEGRTAAETMVREVQADYVRLETADQWVAQLRQIDSRIGAGESTGVVVDLRTDGICGSSVGDSQAWLIHEGQITNLTSHQQRKPLLGSRSAGPVGFSHLPLTGVLIVATDGFCNYVNQHDLARMVAQTDFFAIPRSCVQMVRLPSGDLWDDIGIVACRVQPPHRSRRRYSV